MYHISPVTKIGIYLQFLKLNNIKNDKNEGLKHNSK